MYKFHAPNKTLLKAIAYYEKQNEDCKKVLDFLATCDHPLTAKEVATACDLTVMRYDETRYPKKPIGTEISPMYAMNRLHDLMDCGAVERTEREIYVDTELYGRKVKLAVPQALFSIAKA